ncbi:MAG: R3H domain-containing nucleic acid-binding protein [Dehalococcoidia bacterium]
MSANIETNLNVLFESIPSKIADLLIQNPNIDQLLEVVLDLGRQPEARFIDSNVPLNSGEITLKDLEFVVNKVGNFGSDNRAGIERTLHRISAIRNRDQRIVGITFRVGRAVYGTIKIIEDLILSGKSVLLLGKPGVGKTTMLREVARVLADEANKRVIVVDTSNEIAGDGDIPHKAIGRARRMQVHSLEHQHSIMIEAVQNHMPEVIVIDEIGTALEANAARTIAERGVQLVATAHGNTLENLVLNPVLSDLVGGIESVTLGDIEAKRRKSQKTVLERKSSPTFDILVEIQNWDTVNIHLDITTTLDKMLRDKNCNSELRKLNSDGSFDSKKIPFTRSKQNNFESSTSPTPIRDFSKDMPYKEDPFVEKKYVLPYGVNRGRIDQVIKHLGAPIILVNDMKQAEIVVTTKNYHRRGTQALKDAEKLGKPVFVLRKNTVLQIEHFVKAILKTSDPGISDADRSLAILEAEQAAKLIDSGETEIALRPQNSYLRRIQHQIADEHGLESSSQGQEPSRRVVISGNI